MLCTKMFVLNQLSFCETFFLCALFWVEEILATLKKIANYLTKNWFQWFILLLYILQELHTDKNREPIILEQTHTIHQTHYMGGGGRWGGVYENVKLWLFLLEIGINDNDKGSIIIIKKILFILIYNFTDFGILGALTRRNWFGRQTCECCGIKDICHVKKYFFGND